jgi:hypothetical protein
MPRGWNDLHVRHPRRPQRGGGELGGPQNVGLMLRQCADARDAQKVEQLAEQPVLLRGNICGDCFVTNHDGNLHSTMLVMLSRRTLLQILAAGPLAAAGRDSARGRCHSRREHRRRRRGAGGPAQRHARRADRGDGLGRRPTDLPTVPPDEHPWVEIVTAEPSSTAPTAATCGSITATIIRSPPKHAAAEPQPRRWFRLAHHPRTAVSLAVLEAMLAPWISAGQLTVLLRHKPVKADATGDRVRERHGEEPRNRGELTFTAPYFIDATELGDVLPLTKTEYVTGFESKTDRRTPARPRPPSRRITRPSPSATPSTTSTARTIRHRQAGRVRLLARLRAGCAAVARQAAELGDVRPGHASSPAPSPSTRRRSGRPGPLNLWLYRRIANKANFAGPYNDISLINWPQNDYWLGNLTT